MEPKKKIVIFCSSSYDIDPIYTQAARELVRAACARGYTLVSGGTIKGTMGVVSKEASDCGCYHKGVIPRFMEEYVYPNLSELVWTETMSERKDEMRRDTVAAIALPGSIGTMDELIETYVLAKVGKYSGKVIVLNLNGFYDPLKELLNHFIEAKTMPINDLSLISFPESVEEIIKCIEE